MYELILVIVFIWVVFRAFDHHEKHTEDIPQKITDRVGKLWDIAHQGMRGNKLLRAEKALLTILKIDQKNAAAYNRLGILYAKQKQYKDAIDCFEIASGLEATPSSLHNLGLIYYETENYEKSVTAFEEALKLEDNMAARHIALAKALEHTGNEKLMIEHLERAVEIEPSKESFTLLARGYRQQGAEDKADLIEDKLKKISGSPKAKTTHRMRVRRPKRVVL